MPVQALAAEAALTVQPAAAFPASKKPRVSAAQTAEKSLFFHISMKNETYDSITCKRFNTYGAEGFQRAIGKPFGRLRRGEILCACKHAFYNFRLSKNPREVSEGLQPLRLLFVSAGFASCLRKLNPTGGKAREQSAFCGRPHGEETRDDR